MSNECGPKNMPIIVTKTDAQGRFIRVEPTCTLPNWVEWPETTSILCWNCCHGFSTRPIPLPTKYDEHKNEFHVVGNFCSWGCAKAYSRDYGKSISSRGTQAMTIALLRKRLTGHIASVTAAAPRVVLKAFGGYMDIEEYRKSSDESLWSLPPPRLVTQAQVVHDRKMGEILSRSRVKHIDLSSQIDLGASSSAAPAVESLRLKRPKQVKKTSNMLEIALGLVAK